nr:LacI family DNA-binding transcriptional regulator [Geomicrobium sp. JCM 19039]
MGKVTIADVAALAEVSKSTVSQYMNERFHYMSHETKKKIERAIDELEYSPNGVARSLRQKKTRTIGVIVANILHEFSTGIVRAIEDTCHANNFHVIVCNADDQPEKEKHYIDMLRAKQVDGLIVLPTSDNQALFTQLVEQHYPLVFLDRLIEDVEVNAVLSDNLEAVRLAVEELVGKGYEKIGLITQPIKHHITLGWNVRMPIIKC